MMHMHHTLGCFFERYFGRTLFSKKTIAVATGAARRLALQNSKLGPLKVLVGGVETLYNDQCPMPIQGSSIDRTRTDGLPHILTWPPVVVVVGNLAVT